MVGEQLTVSGQISIGLQWDVQEAKEEEAKHTNDTTTIDLDVSAVLFNQQGSFKESIYFGNLRSVDGAVQHTGDNTNGEGEGDDEEIVLDLKSIDPSVQVIFICINSYSGCSLASVASAVGRIVQVHNKKSGTDVELMRHELSQFSEGYSTALIVYRLVRHHQKQGAWIVRMEGQSATCQSFAQLLPLMQINMKKDVLPNTIVQQAHDVVVLAKGESVVLSQIHEKGIAPSHITLGLGWDVLKGGDAVDLDASCVLFDHKSKVHDAIFFNHLRAKDGSVIHKGDNLTGEGAGDDETIQVNLKRLHQNVQSLYFVVNSYSGHSFSLIENAYVRLLDTSNPQEPPRELVRFSLSGSNHSSKNTAMLMCRLEKSKQHNGKWVMKAIGYSTIGSMYKDNIKEMQKDIAGRLKMQKGGFQFKPNTKPPSYQEAVQHQQNQHQNDGRATISLGVREIVVIIAFLVFLALWK